MDGAGTHDFGRPDGVTAELRRSGAWRGCSIYERRLLDHLIGQYQAGAENGQLTARRLDVERVISTRKVSGAIDGLEAKGLVDIIRGSGIQPSRYALTWLPVCDDIPSDRWRSAFDDDCSGVTSPGDVAAAVTIGDSRSE